MFLIVARSLVNSLIPEKNADYMANGEKWRHTDVSLASDRNE